jgi:hypothetical protein
MVLGVKPFSSHAEKASAGLAAATDAIPLPAMDPASNVPVSIRDRVFFSIRKGLIGFLLGEWMTE